MNPFYPFLVLIAAAVLPYLPWKSSQESLIRSSGVLSGALTLLFTGLIAVPVLQGASQSWFHFWSLNQFSAFLSLIVAFIYFSATLVSYRYIGHEYEDKLISFGQVRLYYTLLPLFILAMLAAVFSDNIGMLWVTIEATTLATTLLVAFYKKEGALEAAWKYIILCSTGISLGLIGILMISYAAVSSGALSADQALSLSLLKEHAKDLSPDIMRWAFVFIFVGFGSKVGFFPMHTWLPDAHSRTPSPISGLLSGVLLNVAFFAILQVKGLTDITLQQSTWTSNFFLAFGFISVVFPAFVFLTQKNYKRLLAYSSIKHMGFIAFALGMGPVGVIPAIIHLAGHALSKSALFFSAGEILAKFKTTKSANIQEGIKVLPYTGTLFIAALLALLAVPPSGLFVSEMLIVVAGIKAHLFLTLAVLACLTLVFVGMLRHVIAFLVAKPETPTEEKSTLKKESFNIVHIVVIAHILLVVLLGASYFTEMGQTLLQGIAKSL